MPSTIDVLNPWLTAHVEGARQIVAAKEHKRQELSLRRDKEQQRLEERGRYLDEMKLNLYRLLGSASAAETALTPSGRVGQLPETPPDLELEALKRRISGAGLTPETLLKMKPDELVTRGLMSGLGGVAQYGSHLMDLQQQWKIAQAQMASRAEIAAIREEGKREARGAAHNYAFLQARNIQLPRAKREREDAERDLEDYQASKPYKNWARAKDETYQNLRSRFNHARDTEFRIQGLADILGDTKSSDLDKERAVSELLYPEFASEGRPPSMSTPSLLMGPDEEGGPSAQQPQQLSQETIMQFLGIPDSVYQQWKTQKDSGELFPDLTLPHREYTSPAMRADTLDVLGARRLQEPTGTFVGPRRISPATMRMLEQWDPWFVRFLAQYEATHRGHQ